MKFPPLLPFRSCSQLAGLALATGLAGCLSDPDSNPHRNQASNPTHNVAEGIYGTMLYAKELGEDHTVEFYDFGEGTLAIRESGSMDKPGKPILPTMTIHSLQDAYRKLNPDATSIPEAIRKADIASIPKVWKPGVDQEFTVVPTNSRRTLAKSSAQQASCSADHFGDGWGGEWFNSNFCTEGNFRWCIKNYGWAESGQLQRPWSKWMQMEGDFNERGHIRGDRRHDTWYRAGLRTTFMEHDIYPRRWEAWTQGGSDKFWFSGSSTCGHMHVNLMWN